MKFHTQAISCIFATAVAATSARADVIPPKVILTTPGGVNVADGSLIYSNDDISIGTLKLERFARTGLQPDRGFMLLNWAVNFDIYVSVPLKKASRIPSIPARYTPIVHIGSGASGVYEQDYLSDTAVVSYNIDAFSGILGSDGTSYTYTDSSGTIYHFTPTVRAPGPNIAQNNSQRVSSIVYSNGRVENFSYDSSGNLHLVADTAGYAILMDYDSNGFIKVACGFDLSQTYVSTSSTCAGAALSVSYNYSLNTLSFVDVLHQTTIYTSDQYGVTCVKPPGYSSCKLSTAYGGAYAPGQAAAYQQTLADGSIWNVSASASSGDPSDPDVIPTDGDNEGSITDPNGKTTYFTFTKSSPYTMTDANGNTTHYKYDGGPQFDYTGPYYHEGKYLREVDFPEGNKYLATYSGPYHEVTQETMQAKPGSGLADLVKQYGYGDCFTAPGTLQNCGKPIWIKDPKGNQIDFAYASWGGLLSEMQPSPTTGAARPLKLYEYVQKYAYIKNSGGALVAASTPIWEANSETVCQTVAGSSSPVCDTAAPITVTTYEYGAPGTADNLLVRGKVVTTNTPSGAPTLRTCYGYDAQSRKISETSPRGTTSASCS
jgi:YD repeat-containing protein